MNKISNNDILSLSQELFNQSSQLTQCMMYSNIDFMISSIAFDLFEAIKNKNNIFIFGNGGSCCDAQHFATELVVRFKENRKPFSAIALGVDASINTAIINDFCFDYLFERQLEALAKPGDVAIGITTSGKSVNVLRALQFALQNSLITIAMTGEDGLSECLKLNYLLKVPSKITPRIQEAHILIIHIICEIIERCFFEELLP